MKSKPIAQEDTQEWLTRIWLDQEKSVLESASITSLMKSKKVDADLLKEKSLKIKHNVKNSSRTISATKNQENPPNR